MIIRNESNRTSLTISTAEALQLIAELATALEKVNKYRISAKQGLFAVEDEIQYQTAATTQFAAIEAAKSHDKPSLFVIVVSAAGEYLKEEEI